MTRVVFIMSRILGNNTYAARIEAIAKANASAWGIDPIILNFEAADYTNYIHPFNKFSNIFRTSLTAHKKLAKTIKYLKPDILFFNTWEALPAFISEIKATTTILGHDTTTVCHHELASLSQKHSLAATSRMNLMRQIYKLITREINFFLPMTNWAKESLIRDFSVAGNNILVAPPPIDTELWTSGLRLESATQPRLLFVGNDFERKGGLFLLDLYAKHLSAECSLAIVSNDKSLSQMQLPAGVQLFQGITQNRLNELIQLYQQSDLLVHPTRKDWCSFAIIEASAVGLPAVSTDIGGIGDLIIPGKTGELLPFSASAQEWAACILRLIKAPGKRQLMGLAAREHAVKSNSYDVFAQSLATAFAQTQAGHRSGNRFARADRRTGGLRD